MSEDGDDSILCARVLGDDVPHRELPFHCVGGESVVLDLVAVPSDEDGIGRCARRLQHFADPALKGRIVPIRQRLVRHVMLDLHRAAIQRVAGRIRVELGEGGRLDAALLERSSEAIEVLQVDTRRVLPPCLIPLELAEAAAHEEALGPGRVALVEQRFQPANRIPTREVLDFLSEPRAEALTAIRRADHDEALRAVDIALAVLSHDTLGGRGKRAIGRPGAEIQHRLVSDTQAFAEHKARSIRRPGESLVSQGEPRIQIVGFDKTDGKRRAGRRHEGRV